MTPRVIAIDWSGAASGAANLIWIAEVEDGVVTRLENEGVREQVRLLLVSQARPTPQLVVGFDFAFSYPAWFLRERSRDDAPALWEIAATDGETWLRDCAPPFWGRPG